MSEQGVQEGPLCLGSAWRMCWYLPLPPRGGKREVFSPRILSLLMSFEDTMVLNTEL
jgi:hypothetical protein